LQFDQLVAFDLLRHLRLIARLKKWQFIRDVEIRPVCRQLPVLLVHHNLVSLLFIFLVLGVCFGLGSGLQASQPTESRVLESDQTFCCGLGISSKRINDLASPDLSLLAVNPVFLLHVLKLHNRVKRPPLLLLDSSLIAPWPDAFSHSRRELYATKVSVLLKLLLESALWCRSLLLQLWGELTEAELELLLKLHD